MRVFYARFETSDFSLERKAIRQQLQHETLPIITADEARIIFNKINPKNANGPDQIRGRILKERSEQLSPIFGQLFKRSLDRHYILKVCKSSIIVPVPKVVKPSVFTDDIPIALTSITIKSLEWIGLKYVLSDSTDPLQSSTISTATWTGPNNVLFIQFSFAFNIRPNIMMERFSSKC